MSATTALLLAAGQATRLGDLRRLHAKACLPVAGVSPLAFLLPRLAAAGVERAWVNLHHRGEQVRAEAQLHAPPSLELRFLEEPELLGTGGSLLAVAEQAGEPPELVLNAKIYTDFPFASLARRGPACLVLHPASELQIFGGFRYDDRNRITGLQPKGAPALPDRAAVYTGICRPDPAWLEALGAARQAAPRAPLCLVRHGLLPVLERGREVQAVLHHGRWAEISTPERAAAAEALVAELLR